MGKSFGRTLGGVLALMLVGGAGGLGTLPAAALSNPNDFCTGNPCVITSDKTVDAGAVVDFGTRTVILQSQLTVANLPSGAVGAATIRAGTFQVAGSGFIKASNSGAPAGGMTIEAIDNILFNGVTSLGDVRLSGQDAGTLNLKTTNGSVSGNGRLTLNGDGTLASGGFVNIDSGANVQLGGNISMSGGTQGGGGAINVVAAGDVSLTGFLNLSGGDVGGGFLDASVGGSITFGAMDLSGSADAGDAGIVTLFAGGNVSFNGTVTGRGADNFESCGDGADIDVTANGDITLAAPMTIQGRGLDCTGGFLALDGERVFLNALLDMSGTGLQGEGGDLDVSARTLLRQVGTVQLDGGDGGAGDLLYFGDAAVEVLGTINANGRSTNSPGATLVDIQGAQLTVSGTINAKGGVNGGGGDVSLTGCDVVVSPGSVVDATGPFGLITIEGTDTIFLRGTFLADVLGGNQIEVNTKSNPPNIAGAFFSPPPAILVSPFLPPCRVCDTNAQCSDGEDCTDDVCDPQTGCSHTVRESGPCNDANACTSGDMCVSGVCTAGAPVVCNDNNPCTADACFPAIGCLGFPQAGSCDDGDACTTGDACELGACVGTATSCNDGNPCTDDSCSGGACSYSFNTAPCGDGNICTNNDVCSNGVCVGGGPIDCSDSNVCTLDACFNLIGCLHFDVPDCVDTDGDQKRDEDDECTTRSWTASPTTPPNQHPLKFRAKMAKLTGPDGDQILLFKGLFNVAPGGPILNPAVHGAHVYAEDDGGALFDVSLPAGPGCGPDDGWTTVGSTATQTWKYRNKSGALPPGCAPGSARGIAILLIKDGRSSAKQALQFKVKAKDATLLRDPGQPLTRIQVSLALAAQPAPGSASPQAIAGQCAEALFTGNPIPSGSTKPTCRSKLRSGQLDGVNCKGL